MAYLLERLKALETPSAGSGSSQGVLWSAADVRKVSLWGTERVCASELWHETQNVLSVTMTENTHKTPPSTLPYLLSEPQGYGGAWRSRLVCVDTLASCARDAAR